MIAPASTIPTPAQDIIRRLASVVVVDLETSGLDCHRHSILEFGAARFGLGVEEGGQVGFPTFELKCRCWEVHLPHQVIRAEYEPKALEVNGRTPEDIYDESFLTEQKATKQFFEWLGEGEWILAGMNPTHDYNFLKAAGDRAGIRKIPFVHRKIDLHSVAVMFAIAHGMEVNPRGIYTDGIYQMIGMPNEPKPHRAATGAGYEAQALLKMLVEI